ncbi:MAG: DUF6062 family protein [Chloroflexota bacterium]|nr:DUF6062 family protein [Chloroflexota bacterium]
MTRKPGKHTPYFELLEAQDKAGCPICRLVYQVVDHYLDSVLYEAVLDPDVRAELKAARGFCEEHVRMLYSKPGRALGIALIYRDIIRETADVAEEVRHGGAASLLGKVLGKDWASSPSLRRLETSESCPACVVAQRAEDDYLGLLVAYLDDEEFHEAYAQGEGLCLPHFLQALGRAKDDASVERLVRPQVARYRAMLSDLDEFIRKRDHRFRHEKYGGEGDVWLRAMNAIVGGAGMGLSAASGGRRSDDL